jgi:DNA polymerase III sliding clamp (beta) subunit (PCNA family)
MKVQRKQLISILAKVNPGLAAKAVIEQSECFIFQGKRVYTFNDEIAVSHPIDFELAGAVNGKKLLDTLKKGADDEIDIFIKDGMIRVHGKKSRAGLKIDEEIKLPFGEVGDNEEAVWINLPEDFCKAVHFCLFSTSRDASRPLLTCVHINGDEVESCDNFRMTKYTMSDGVPDCNLLIPADAAKDLISFAPTQVAKVGGWLHFSNADDVIFCCRTYGEPYPNLGAILECEGEEAKLPEGIVDALERAEIFGEAAFKGTSARVTVTLGDGRMTVRGEGDHGFFEEEMRLRYKGEATFEIAAAFFAEVLQHTNTATIGDRKLMFNGEQWVHVVSLIKKS